MPKITITVQGESFDELRGELNAAIGLLDLELTRIAREAIRTHEKSRKVSLERLKKITIEDLELSVRTSNVLRTMGIETAYDIISVPAYTYKKQHGMGARSVMELQDIARGFGFNLGTIDDDAPLMVQEDRT